MTEFVNVAIQTNEAELIDEAVDKLIEEMEAKGYVGWEPLEAGLETIVLGASGPLAATVAQVAATVPAAIFRAYGTQLVKLAFNEGAQATVFTKWTITESATETIIPEGTTLELGGIAFYVAAEVKVAAKATTATKVQIIANERGTEANGLSGTVEQVNPLSFATHVETEGETSGGTNQETDEAYLNRLAAQLALQAPRPITAENYAAFTLTAPSTVAPVGRATAIDGYNGETHETNAHVTNNSTEITEIASETGLTVGTEVVGAGVPKGTTLVSKTKAGEWRMSAKATETTTLKTYKFVGSYENPRYVTVFVANAKGEALSGALMTKIEEWLKGYRELNFKVVVAKPEENKVFVKAKVKVLPTFEALTVKANVETAIKNLLSPEKWGNPTGSTSGATQWLNYVVKGGVGEKLYGTVKYNQVLGAIEAVPGVAYVVTGGEGLEIGLESGAKGTGDLAMVGAAPLPKAEIEGVTTS